MSERSVTPLVGIILLFGLVMIGAALVVVTGMALIDTLESGSERERTETCLDEAEHRISTVVTYDTDETLPCEGGQYIDDGEVYLVWHDNATVDIDELDDVYEKTSVNATLGAIEYSGGDRTYAYQSGGTWEVSDDYTRVLSGPAIEYGDELRISVLTIDEDDLRNDVTRVSRHSEGTLADEIQAAQRDARSEGYGNLSLVIESEYHDGWADHLDSSMVDENASVTHDADDRSVQVDIANATTATEAEFFVTGDEGLRDEYGEENVFIGWDTPASPDPTAGPNTGFDIAAVVENTGRQDGAEDVEISITDPDDPSHEYLSKIREDVSINGTAERTIDFNFTAGAVNSGGIEFGEVYDYDIVPENDRNGFDERGSFYVAFDEDSYLDVRNPRINEEDASNRETPVAVEGENVTLEVDLHNIGAANATEEALELEVETSKSPDADPYELADEPDPSIDRSFGQNETVAWTVNGSKLLDGEHTFTVTAVESGEAATGHFDVEDGVDVGDTDLVVPSETDVNVSIIGSELSTTDPVRWLPTYVNVFTQPLDDGNDPIGDPERHEEMDWADTNLNRHDERLTIYEYDFTTEERVSLMLQATSYRECGDWRWQDNIDGTDTYDCETGDEYNTHVDLTADTETEESNVRVLNETRNTMPELEPGIDVQMRADELLQRDGVDIEVTENDDEDVYDGEGYDLHLGENEFVFLFEITHHPEQFNHGPRLDSDVDWTNQRYWEEAFERQGGDPNFNDVIAHVEIDPPDTPADFGFESEFDSGDGQSVDFGPGTGSDGDTGAGDGSGVDVGGDEIIIG